MEDIEDVLCSFFVFDSNIAQEEGAVVDILFYYPEKNDRESLLKRQVEAGLSSTFLFFCKQFRPSENCDYVFTGKREISLLEIGEGIYFSLSIRSNTQTKRLLLQSILNTCKSILFLSIGPMKRINGGPLPKSWVNELISICLT